MAIDSRNFSIEGVEDILQEGNYALTSLSALDNDSNILMAIDRIKQKIIFLQGLEDKMLKLFPAPNSREWVRAKIAEYDATDFKNFFGGNLKSTFTEAFFRAAEANKNKDKQEQNLLAEFIIQEIDKVIKQQMQNNNTKKDIAAEAISYFNSWLATKDSSGKFSSTRKTQGMIDVQDGIPHIVIEHLTPAMRSRLQQILDASTFGQTKVAQLFPNLKVNMTNFQSNKTSINIRVKSDWYNITKGMKASEIENKIKNDSTGYWQNVLDQANRDIIELLCKEVSGEVRMYLYNYLVGLTHKNPYVFYVGKSTTDITGLLGEIAAILAIQKLTGKTVSVEWIAHNTANGKKVSIDVVLNHCLGINVKNTTQDFDQFHGFHNVSFVDRNPKDILDKLLGTSSINDSISDAFQTSYFNLSYQITHKKPHVIKGSNRHFDEIEQGLIDFRQHLITFLYQFAPELLYMATDDLEKQLLILDEELDKNISGNGNILYMVGGVPFFPSEMLSDLLADLTALEQDLRNGEGFRKKSFFLNISKGSSTTIIDVLNDRANSGLTVKLEDFYGSYEDTHLIQMTSSWLF